MIERRPRLIGLIGAVALCTLGLSSRGLALDDESATAEAAAGHVVEPAQAPSIGAVFREVPTIVLTRHSGWKAAIPAYLGATYIAASRVHDNKHYLSDVTFGAAMGIAGSRTVLLKKGRSGLQVAPSPAAGTVALRATMVSVRH